VPLRHPHNTPATRNTMSYYNFNDIDKALTELGSNPSGEDALAFIMGTSVGDAMLASRRNQPLPTANPAWDDDIDAAVVRSTWPSGIKRKVPNATGTYYSFSEQPGVSHVLEALLSTT
jgi:hypothetical protein